MKRFILFLAAVGIGIVVAICLRPNRERAPEAIEFTNSVATVAAGYPLASEFKDRLAGDAKLTRAVVELARGEQDVFQVKRIHYDFISTKDQGRLFTIVVDNTDHRTYASMDSAEVGDSVPLKVGIWEPVDVAGTREVAEVLAIATTNGLGEFCALYPGEYGAVALRLKQADHRAAWQVLGMAANKEGHALVLQLQLDARTGAVISREFEKPASAAP